jgi:hypothetical protein
MRLSSQKAAHANLADAACRKSGSQQRTWAEKDGRSPSNVLVRRPRALLKAQIFFYTLSESI